MRILRILSRKGTIISQFSHFSHAIFCMRFLRLLRLSLKKSVQSVQSVGDYCLNYLNCLMRFFHLFLDHLGLIHPFIFSYSLYIVYAFLIQSRSHQPSITFHFPFIFLSFSFHSRDHFATWRRQSAFAFEKGRLAGSLVRPRRKRHRWVLFIIFFLIGISYLSSAGYQLIISYALAIINFLSVQSIPSVGALKICSSVLSLLSFWHIEKDHNEIWHETFVTCQTELYQCRRVRCLTCVQRPLRIGYLRQTSRCRYSFGNSK